MSQDKVNITEDDLSLIYEYDDSDQCKGCSLAIENTNLKQQLAKAQAGILGINNKG